MKHDRRRAGHVRVTSAVHGDGELVAHKFRKRCEKSGILGEMRERLEYIKPSEKRRKGELRRRIRIEKAKAKAAAEERQRRMSR